MSKNIVLVGFMGAGKTTVGRELADVLGWSFIDSDDLIESETGKHPSHIINSHGEQHFRDLERKAVARCAELCSTVIALGGGAWSKENRQQLAGSVSVCLKASWDTVCGRVGTEDDRPMWSGGEELFRSRRQDYRLTEHAVATDDRSVSDVVDDIVGMVGIGREGVSGDRQEVIVTPESRSIVQTGILSDIGDLVRTEFGAVRAMVVTEPLLGCLYGGEVVKGLQSEGIDARMVHTQGGEEGKTLKEAARLLDQLAREGFNRDDVVVCLGGGVVGDLGGFVASVYMRGMNVVQVPTTLLAMVDASLGGKTGVNRLEIKNLVGTFHQPRLIISDPLVLRSLPERQMRSGMGEVVKYGWGFDGEVLSLIRAEADKLLMRDPGVLTSLVVRCQQIKADVCRRDERETGERMKLNFGHTIGHALETMPGFDLMHGEAVGLGLMCAAKCSELMGIGDVSCEDVRKDLEIMGLPTELAPQFCTEQTVNGIENRLLLDKKRRENELQMILPEKTTRTVVRCVNKGIAVASLRCLWEKNVQVVHHIFDRP